MEVPACCQDENRRQRFKILPGDYKCNPVVWLIHFEEIKSAVSLALGYIFLLSCHRADRVTAFASNFNLICPSIPAGIATVFFAGAHHTTAWNVRTDALLRVIHQFSLQIYCE
jgi:hypothetical protein